MASVTGPGAGVEFSRIIEGLPHSPVVYFLRMGDRVKIGTTTNLSERVRALSVTLKEVAYLVPGGEEVERMMHDRWASLRIYPDREWFYVRGPLATFLRSGARATRPGTVPPQARQAHPGGGPVGLSEAVRTGVLTVSLESARAARKRDPEFPEPVGKRGQEMLYDPDALRRWERNRPRSAESAV